MTRVLCVVFDALRPEFVRPELMPRLSEFRDSGVHYKEYRSTFPTETRVNQSALTTGCLARRHGVVGNVFIAPDLGSQRLINTGDDDQLEKALAAGPLLAVPNLAERLVRAGRSFASLSAGTPGGGRLINHSAEAIGSTRFAMRAPQASVPSSLHAELVAIAGPIPDPEAASQEWIEWAVRAYLEGIESEVRPDVGLLWLCEPDECFHWKEIGGPDTVRILASLDVCFGRILDSFHAELQSGGMHIIALSDHGQLSLDGPRLRVTEKLGEAGWTANRSGLENGDDLAVVLGTGGGIWVRDRHPALVEEVTNWLLEQDWCGPVFNRDGLAGALPSSSIGIDHSRAPDIALSLSTSASKNAHGIVGVGRHDAPYPAGGGCHGGLSPWELGNFLAMGGAQFKRSTTLSVPAGNADILPTLLALMGLPEAMDIDGRRLLEAFDEEPLSGTETAGVRSIQARGGTVEWREFRGRRYLDRAYRR